ncbi:MAG: hypothetical protein ABI193_00715 [Minicystis sp.]
MHLPLDGRLAALLLVIAAVGLSGCKGASSEEDAAGKGAEQAATSAVVSATATASEAGKVSVPGTSQPVLLWPSSAAPPVLSAPGTTAPGGTGTTAGTGSGKVLPHGCPPMGCGIRPGCLEMGHDSAGCPTCTCARWSTPPLGGPPKKP